MTVRQISYEEDSKELLLGVSLIGASVRKKSKRKFKSGDTVEEVLGLIRSPITNRWSAIFKGDYYVEIRILCII